MYFFLHLSTFTETISSNHNMKTVISEMKKIMYSIRHDNQIVFSNILVNFLDADQAEIARFIIVFTKSYVDKRKSKRIL